MATRRKPISPKLRALVLSRDGSRCLMCGAKAGDLGVTLEVDHVVPVADGGTDDLDNLATLCQPCNRGKSSLRLRDYRLLSLVPDDIARDFVLYHDPPSGDLERFHLYLYFFDAREGPRREEKLHREWTISGTQLAASRDPAALAARRGAEEREKFEQDIRCNLAAALCRLIRTEEGLERVSANVPPPLAL